MTYPTVTFGVVDADGGQPVLVDGKLVLFWYPDEMSKDEAVEQALELGASYKRGAQLIRERREGQELAAEFFGALLGSIGANR